MIVPVKRFVLFGFAALLTLFAIGCDSQSSMEDECPGDISVFASPANLSLFVGEGEAAFQIGGDTLGFRHSTDRKLTYFVNSGASDIVETQISGSDILHIMPLRAGEASVEVKARDACGQVQTATFTVNVLDACIENPGTINVLSSPASLSLYAGEEGEKIRVGGDSLAFDHTLGRPLSYSIVNHAGDVVAASLHESDARFIELTPRQSGTAQIEVTATDKCGVSETAVFNVDVMDVCARVANQVYDVYFPVEVGKAWTYSYQSDSQGMNHPHAQTTGTLRWELTSATACEDGRQSFSIQETFEGVTTLPADNPDYREPQSWARMLEGKISGRSLHLGRYTEDLPAQWIYPASAPDTVETQFSAVDPPYASEGAAIVLQRETGITRWNTGRSGVHNEYSSTRITLDQ